MRYGIALGVPLYGLGYYGGYYPYPYTYSDPAYRYPGWGVAHPGEYIDQGIPNEALQPQDDWFYCADSKAYYPYVRECPGGWQRVPSTPPR